MHEFSHFLFSLFLSEKINEINITIFVIKNNYVVSNSCYIINLSKLSNSTKIAFAPLNPDHISFYPLAVIIIKYKHSVIREFSPTTINARTINMMATPGMIDKKAESSMMYS